MDSKGRTMSAIRKTFARIADALGLVILLFGLLRATNSFGGDRTATAERGAPAKRDVAEPVRPSTTRLAA